MYTGNKIAFRLRTGNITQNPGCIGESYGRQEGPKSDRQARRKPGANATNDAGHEPGKAGGCTRTDLPAGAEIRKGDQPDRREPVATNLSYPAGPGGILLRRRAQLAWHRRRPERSAVTGLRVGLSCHLRRTFADKGLHADQGT